MIQLMCKSYILIVLFVHLSVCRGPETQIPSVRLSVEVLKPRSRLFVCLSRSWNPDRDPSVRLSVEVLKPRSQPVNSLYQLTVWVRGIHLELSITRRFFEVFSPTQTRALFDSANFQIPGTDGSLILIR